MQSVFDLVEDMDFKTCKDVLVELGGRDAACSCPEKSLVPCGYFAWRSVSDHTLARRKQQCSSQALVCAGHFAKAYKSISEPTLSERLATCQEKALICAGHFEQSFRSISEPTLQDRLAQCNETAVVCAGHFQQSFRTLSDHSLEGSLLTTEDISNALKNILGKDSGDEPCITEECQDRTVELMKRLLRTSGNSGDDSIYSVVWGEDQLAMEHSFIPTADSNSSGSGSGTSCGSGKAADYITGRTSKTASVSKSPRHGASNGGGFAGVAAYDAKAK